MDLLPCYDPGPFVPHILTTGLHLGCLPSMACFSTRTHHLSSPPTPNGLRLFLSQTFSCVNTPTVSSRLFFLLTLPMKMEQTERSETSAHKTRMPGNHPREKTREKVCFYQFHHVHKTLKPLNDF